FGMKLSRSLTTRLGGSGAGSGAASAARPHPRAATARAARTVEVAFIVALPVETALRGCRRDIRPGLCLAYPAAPPQSAHPSRQRSGRSLLRFRAGGRIMQVESDRSNLPENLKKNDCQTATGWLG